MPTKTQLEELLAAEPDDLFLRYALAKACVSEGEIERGLSLFEEVLERDPDYVAAYFQKGQALVEAGRAEDARDALTRGIATARKVGDSHAEAEMTAFLDTLT